MEFHKWVLKCDICNKPQCIYNLFFTHSDQIMVETVCAQCSQINQHVISVFDMMAVVCQMERNDLIVADCVSHAVN